jgi:uncharacterized protein
MDLSPQPYVNRRLPGPDVVRAIAIAGVVTMNYYGYLINRGGTRGSGWVYDLFDTRTGPLTTRFAALFVVTAGVGVTLLTRSAAGDRQRTIELRWRLARRGIVLYAFGLAFNFVWPGTILPYYGAMFLIAALLFTLRIRWLATVGAVAALAGWLIRWWMYERQLDGGDTTWLTRPGPRSPRGLLYNVFVNGTHPLLPWLAFLCAGIVLGRLLVYPWWRPAATLAGVLGVGAGLLAELASTTARTEVVLSPHPFDRGLAYTATALGSSLIAFAGIDWLVAQYAGSGTAGRAIEVLRRAGSTSLSIYVAHALVFNLLVDWLDLVSPGGIATALVFALVYWAAAIAAADWWVRRFGQGPAEHLYRKLSA